MFCKKCGKELEEEVSFCKYCGTAVNGEKREKNSNISFSFNGVGGSALLDKLFSCKGRCARREYAIVMIALIALEWFAKLIGINSLLMLGISYIELMYFIKRLHDMNCSGWFATIGVITKHYFILALVVVSYRIEGIWNMVPLYIYLIFLAVLWFVKGTDGPNKYGPDPLKQ